MSASALFLGSIVTAGVAGPSIAAPRSETEAPAYVVVTHATVQRAGRLRFAMASFRLVGQMAGLPGLIRQEQGIRRFGAEVWTATAWKDKAAMASFVRGPQHVAAMRESAFSIIAMSSWHLECDVASMPQRFGDVLKLRDGQIPKGCRVLEMSASESARDV